MGSDAHPPRVDGAGARNQLPTVRVDLTCCSGDRRLPRQGRNTGETDWPRIVALYDVLAEVTPNPVVELNRAVAVGWRFGPATGLELVEALSTEPSLANYHRLPSVRGDLLAKLGRHEEASRSSCAQRH